MDENIIPLSQNEYVKSLFAIMEDNGNDTTGLSALINHVSEMENFVQKAEAKITEMKSQLAELKEVQNHPIKTSLQNTIKSLETKVAEMKNRINALKDNIISSCKTAIAEFREKGATALNNIAKFFHVKSAIVAIDKSAELAMKQCDKAISDISDFAKNYHNAGRAIKNMGRIIIGRKPIDEAKENGKLALAIASPYIAEKSAMNGIRKAIDKAINTLDGMEKQQVVKRMERKSEQPEKTDMLAKIDKFKERVEREKLEIPLPERAKVAGLDV